MMQHMMQTMMLDPLTIGLPSRILRGGCWWLISKGCRTADRVGYVYGYRCDFLGFRAWGQSCAT